MAIQVDSMTSGVKNMSFAPHFKEKVPPAVLKMVALFLNEKDHGRFASSCKAAAHVINDVLYGVNSDYLIRDPSFFEKHAVRMQRFGRHVNPRKWESVPSFPLQRFMPRITALSVNSFSPVLDMLEDASNFPKLTKLSLSRSPQDYRDVLAKVLPQMPKLVSFSLELLAVQSPDVNISADSWKTFAKVSTAIQTLSVNKLRTEHIRMLSPILPQLRSFTYEGDIDQGDIDYHGNYTKIDLEGWKIISQQCSQLTELRGLCCFNDQILQQLTGVLKRLSTLQIYTYKSEKDPVTEVGYSHIAEHCEALQVLRLAPLGIGTPQGAMNDSCLQKLEPLFSRIHTLEIRYCQDLGKESVNMVKNLKTWKLLII